MRSHLAAATLILAVGLGSAFAQSTSQEIPATDPLARSDPAATESPAAKGNAKPAGKKGAKAAKGEANPLPPSVGANAVPAPGGRNVTATGKTMPPAGGRGGAAPVKASTEVQMLQAQKAAEERNKAWDAKMRRTMSTICNGC